MKNIDDLFSIIWLWFRPWVIITIIYTSYACAIHYSKNNEKQKVVKQYWINYDPSKRAEDIVELDYKNRLIIYRTYIDKNTLEDTPQYINSDTGYKSILDSIDWYDLDDYYDLYEYYHD